MGPDLLLALPSNLGNFEPSMITLKLQRYFVPTKSVRDERSVLCVLVLARTSLT